MFKTKQTDFYTKDMIKKEREVNNMFIVRNNKHPPLAERSVYGSDK